MPLKKIAMYLKYGNYSALSTYLMKKSAEPNSSPFQLPDGVSLAEIQKQQQTPSWNRPVPWTQPSNFIQNRNPVWQNPSGNIGAVPTRSSKPIFQPATMDQKLYDRAVELGKNRESTFTGRALTWGGDVLNSLAQTVSGGYLGSKERELDFQARSQQYFDIDPITGKTRTFSPYSNPNYRPAGTVMPLGVVIGTPVVVPTTKPNPGGIKRLARRVAKSPWTQLGVYGLVTANTGMNLTGIYNWLAKNDTTIGRASKSADEASLVWQLYSNPGSLTEEQRRKAKNIADAVFQNAGLGKPDDCMKNIRNWHLISAYMQGEPLSDEERARAEQLATTTGKQLWGTARQVDPIVDETYQTIQDTNTLARAYTRPNELTPDRLAEAQMLDDNIAKRMKQNGGTHAKDIINALKPKSDKPGTTLQIPLTFGDDSSKVAPIELPGVKEDDYVLPPPPSMTP